MELSNSCCHNIYSASGFQPSFLTFHAPFLQSSTDQSTVDMDVPYRLAGLVFALIQLLSIILLMSQVAWQVFLIFVAVFAISCWYQVRKTHKLISLKQFFLGIL